MSLIMSYIKKYKKESLLAPLFKMLEACLELFVPIVVETIIDKGIGASDKTFVIKSGLILFALGITGLASSVTAQYFAAKAAIGCGTDMRNSLFRHVNTFTFSDIDSLGTSALITRITNDINQVQTSINMVLRLLLRSPFIVFGSMIMAFIIDVKASLAFTVAIPLLFLIVFGVMSFNIPIYKKIQNILDTITMLTRENLSGIRVIRAFNREKKETEDFEKVSDNLAELQNKSGRISALLNPLTYVILNSAIIFILWTGGKKVSIGSLSQGEVVALVNYMSQILVELIKLSNLIVTMNKASACCARVKAVFEHEPEFLQNGTRTENSDCEAVVEFNNVSFSYKGSDEPAVENISFKVPQNSVVGIIGSTGSGKSTLVNLIPGFYRCSRGEVRLFGNDVKNYSSEKLSKLISVVPQKAVLFKGTIKSNLLVGNPNASDDEIIEAVRTAQADELINSSEGINAEIQQNGQNLSGGQKQRLTVARALIKKSPVLILDDSMSALDFATDAGLRKAIKEKAGNSVTFIVSQRVSTIKSADMIIVLDDGTQAGCGTHAQLIKTCAVYKEICLSQLSEKEAETYEQ